jgi:uncharacterized protein (DUF1778 family)
MTTDTPAFRKGGRPPKNDLERRCAQLRVRVRPDELAAIEQRAAESNRALPDFVRAAALSAKILVHQSRALTALDRHDLARIGSNLNQIARVCNQVGDTARARNIEVFLARLREILDRMDDIGGPSHELGEGPQDEGPRNVL